MPAVECVLGACVCQRVVAGDRAMYVSLRGAPLSVGPSNSSIHPYVYCLVESITAVIVAGFTQSSRLNILRISSANSYGAINLACIRSEGKKQRVEVHVRQSARQKQKNGE